MNTPPESVIAAAARLGLPAVPTGYPSDLLPLYFVHLLLVSGERTMTAGASLALVRAHAVSLVAAIDSLEESEVRPIRPSREWCCQAPNTVRWDGSVGVQRRQWDLLGILLESGTSVECGSVEDQLGLERPSWGLRKDLSKLNGVLAEILFPHQWSIRDGWVLRS